jgi:hypothetical protein
VNPAIRPVFRQQALRYHAEGREMSVLPRFVHPRTFIWLWIMLAVLTIAGAAVWRALPGLD